MNPTLLIVDDDPFMHTLYEEAFAVDHALVSAETAAEALAMATQHAPPVADPRCRAARRGRT